MGGGGGRGGGGGGGGVLISVCFVCVEYEESTDCSTITVLFLLLEVVLLTTCTRQCG